MISFINAQKYVRQNKAILRQIKQKQQQSSPKFVKRQISANHVNIRHVTLEHHVAFVYTFLLAKFSSVCIWTHTFVGKHQIKIRFRSRFRFGPI